MKQETAVEWLIKELINYDKLLDGKRKNDDATVFKANPTKIYEQAKAMEREQRFEDFKQGFHSAFESLEAANNSVQNKTFKSK